MFGKGYLALLLLASIFIYQPAQAAFIQGENYLHDEQNSVYWSLLDMNLDIARLSWSDTLGLPVQAGVADVNAFVSSNADGWRWATLAEFSAIHNWFDSDLLADGWSAAQKTGSALFFLLNGTGPAFTSQHGYDFEGYTYWQFGTAAENEMQYAWMADFAWQLADISCAPYSLLCSSGYFTDADSPLWAAAGILQMGDLNIAPLLVRNHQSAAVAAIPVSSTGWLLGLGLAGIVLRRRKA